ncbi:hypothetical protein M3689_04610 [Alkalihalophilus marmarensis]|jgi:hypothetical protein|uniref:LysM domain-containing protein n=1 Tax=Alkalihalophilus marmarensis DSM 21297 TaxID=1188261 RepID=U6SVU5_9BACI|nr:hypothetical protein [Alkalihalophilus marmarensis]ERN54796.1 hypothetical protein A33I_05450 [Alkalihalophilus marmarensis DSM 21297]MCM3488584.1 hypothetical protein [Alkalihalophilus marmarensis]
MKRIGFGLIILIILYSVYYDLTIGTLPNGLTAAPEETVDIEEAESVMTNEVSEEPVITEPFVEVVVEPGYTVLSIVEHLHEGIVPFPASIQEVIFDFKHLNQGIEPENIQIGETYKFPYYGNQ